MEAVATTDPKTGSVCASTEKAGRWANKMAQLLKAPASKPADLGLMPGTHLVERENGSAGSPLNTSHVLWCVRHKHMNTIKINKY